LQRAGELGADPAVVAYDRALVHLARGDQAAALDSLRQALSHDRHPPDARRLRDGLLSPEHQPRSSSPFQRADNSAPALGPESR
jgi:Tfp pilus assembly protein PilF